MNTYLVNLECFFNKPHQAKELELFVSVVAESPEEIEEPLRELVVKAQAKAGFNTVEVSHITMMPTEPTIVMSVERSEGGGTCTETDSGWLDPAWYVALQIPQTAEEDAKHFAWLTKYASERGEPAPEWDGKESLGCTIKPFMEFQNVVVAPEDMEQEAATAAPETASEPEADEAPADDSSGCLDVEKIATECGFKLAGEEEWDPDADAPHIMPFIYDVSGTSDDEEFEVGTVHGYRIRHNWTVTNSLKLWDEADSMDADVVTYVDALIRETRACEKVFDSYLRLTSAQHVTILCHLDLKPEVTDHVRAWRDVAACIAMMDVPTIMLVDPHALPDDRKKSVNKLKARNQIKALKELGFVRMVGSRFLWGWNHEVSESSMDGYSYSQLLEAKKEGKLSDVLKAHLSEEVHGKLPDHVKKTMGYPDPDDSMEDM